MPVLVNARIIPSFEKRQAAYRDVVDKLATVTGGANATATLTIAAVALTTHCISHVSVSANLAALAAGTITMSDGVSSMVLDIPVGVAASPNVYPILIPLPLPWRATKGAAVTVVVTALGAAVVAHINAAYFDIVDPS